MLRLPPKRNEWFRDRDGVWARQKMQDEVLTDEVSFADELASGETISSFSWVDTSGPSISGDAINGTSDGITFTVTDSGDTTLSVVTSGGRTLRRELRWIGTDTTALSDYR